MSEQSGRWASGQVTGRRIEWRTRMVPRDPSRDDLQEGEPGPEVAPEQWSEIDRSTWAGEGETS